MVRDSKKDTLKHIRQVQNHIGQIIQCLTDRAEQHDGSRLEPFEKEIQDNAMPPSPTVEYRSLEDQQNTARLQRAVDHHNSKNRHHPEYYGECGIGCMDLIDIIEMLCDWRAATMRSENGDIRKSIEINIERFDIPKPIVRLLNNTIDDLGW